jgi:two-component system, NarL family, invasion response regulator UvrY
MTRLYLLDDHAIVREGLRALLEAAGHAVVGEGADPTQALAELNTLRPDVLLLDLGLGERSGFEVLSGIVARALPVRTLVLSMSAQPRHVADALRLGASGYVLKGSAGADLLRAIDAVAQGQRHLGPEVADLALQGLDERSGSDDPLAVLSPRERQIMLAVVRGRSSIEIGAALHLSPKTVDTYRSRLMAKLGVANLPELVRLAVRCGVLDAETP